MRTLYRGVVFAVVTTVALVTLFWWESSVPRDGMIYPIPNFLGSTWYGPIMVLLIPLSLGWWSLGAKRLYARVIGLVFTLLVLAIWIVFIIAGIEHVRPWILPWPPSGGGVR